MLAEVLDGYLDITESDTARPAAHEPLPRIRHAFCCHCAEPSGRGRNDNWSTPCRSRSGPLERVGGALALCTGPDENGSTTSLHRRKERKPKKDERDTA